ncbi:MAG: hypothetical protein R3E73_05185 [Porticoccaceae bacterium]
MGIRRMKQEQLGVNWGKWGEDDERGAANRVTPLATKRGIAASISGEVLSLAVPLSSSGPALVCARNHSIT